jgi:hypothetical protein
MFNKFFRFKSKKITIIPLILIVVCGFVWWFDLLPALADDWAIIDVIPAERETKMLFTSTDGLATLMIPAGTSTAQASFKFMKHLDPEVIAYSYHYEGIKPAGDLYYLEIVPFEVEYSARPKVTVKFTPENKLKSLYYWNIDNQEFVKLETVRDTKKNTLTFTVPNIRELSFALFEDPIQSGTASWYVHPRYPKELMAASTDFSFGSKVKVTNLANGKEVIVTIKDYGPDKSVHPDRVIDLGKEAFKAIASTRAGVINVTVEPVLAVSSIAGVASAK